MLKSVKWMACCVFLVCATTTFAQPASPLHAGLRIHYTVCSGKSGAAPPFTTIDFIYGPEEGEQNFRWWQMEVRDTTNRSDAPLFVVRALTSTDPLAERQGPLEFSRYQLRIPQTGETFDYRDVNNGQALLPPWRTFQEDFLPRAVSSRNRHFGLPETCELLGQVLSLQLAVEDESWMPWDDMKRLDLDREAMIGTGRNFKDSEGHRLAKGDTSDYTYVPFFADDYQTMIAAGMNLFTVAAEQEKWVRGQPVFYLRRVEGVPPLRYPADLYRANYLGSIMFVDEPASIILSDPNARDVLRRPSDFAALFEERTRAGYSSADSYGAWRLDQALRRSEVNLGDFRLAQTDIPIWDTAIEAAFYEMKGGGSGIVHEGRYDYADFKSRVELTTHAPWIFGAAEMFQFYNALMRGGTRPFGKFWGTAIYGQCDPALAPQALAVVYDMGARYFWFWTSDHAHHVPWPEQLALTKGLKQHMAKKPRASIFLPQPKRDAVIVLPDGYFISLDKFKWSVTPDADGQSATENFHRVLQRSFVAIHNCLERHEDFDITVDDGHVIEGYRRIIKISEKPEAPDE